MCGCGGCGCNDCTGNILYVSEKIVSFCALTSVVICIMLTLAITMGVGIGTGYNYCFVDLKVQPDTGKETASALRMRETAGEDSIPEDKSENAEANYRRTPIGTVSITEPTRTPSVDSYTLALQLHGNIDFPALLARLRVRNKNATLELIT